MGLHFAHDGAAVIRLPGGSGIVLSNGVTGKIHQRSLRPPECPLIRGWLTRFERTFVNLNARGMGLQKQRLSRGRQQACRNFRGTQGWRTRAATAGQQGDRESASKSVHSMGTSLFPASCPASGCHGKFTGRRTPGLLTSHPTNHQRNRATPGVLVSTASISVLMTKRSLAYLSCSSSGKRLAGLGNRDGFIKISQGLSLFTGRLFSRTARRNFSPFKFTTSTEARNKYPGCNDMWPNRLDNCRVIYLARSMRALHLGTRLRLNPTRGAFLMLICGTGRSRSKLARMVGWPSRRCGQFESGTNPWLTLTPANLSPRSPSHPVCGTRSDAHR